MYSCIIFILPASSLCYVYSYRAALYRPASLSSSSSSARLLVLMVGHQHGGTRPCPCVSVCFKYSDHDSPSHQQKTIYTSIKKIIPTCYSRGRSPLSLPSHPTSKVIRPPMLLHQISKPYIYTYIRIPDLYIQLVALMCIIIITRIRIFLVQQKFVLMKQNGCYQMNLIYVK